MIETDAPYLTPIPYRGRRNEPVHVIEVAKKIAEIRSENVDSVAAQLLQNTKETFGITF